MGSALGKLSLWLSAFLPCHLTTQTHVDSKQQLGKAKGFCAVRR